MLFVCLIQKEWLCLNCQTQRALLGQLGDSGKLPQPSPVSAKPETQATPATKKAEPTPAATKSQPTPAPIKAVPTVPTPKEKMEPTSVKMETTATAASAQIELETTLIPTTSKVSPVAAEKQPLAASTAEPIIQTVAPVQQTVVTPKVEVPNTDVPKTVPVENKEEAVKMELSVTEFPKAEESKPNLSKVKVEDGVTAASFFPLTEATVVPTSPIAAEVAIARVVPGIETKPELSAPERVIKEVQPGDHNELTEPTKSLQQVEVQPKSQEPQQVLEEESVRAVDSKEMADKLIEKTIDITSTSETQPVSTKNIIMKVRMSPLD